MYKILTNSLRDSITKPEQSAACSQSCVVHPHLLPSSLVVLKPVSACYSQACQHIPLRAGKAMVGGGVHLLQQCHLYRHGVLALWPRAIPVMLEQCAGSGATHFVLAVWIHTALVL